jgi:Fur family peroxide stress response transcriptional regulator
MRSPAVVENLIKNLKEAGLRVTPQRLAIYESLVRSDAHPTALALYVKLKCQLPSLSQATVYNTLQVLAARGLIQEVGEVGDGAVRYDGNPAPHANVVCTGCQDVKDVFDISLDSITEQVRARSGFDIQDLRITYYGLCLRCQSAQAVEA